MWTPRRLLLFLVGLAVSVGAFVAYSGVLGRIDGLPQLPVEFLMRRTADGPDPVMLTRNTVIDTKLERAFGPGCAEISYSLKLELQKNGLILATNRLDIEPDGRCRMKPFSIAVVRDKGPGMDPEIQTIHADEAYIRFDQPVKTVPDMGKRKIVGCDLVSDPTLLSPDPRRHRITCNHNRGTTDPADDLFLETVGPVKYNDQPEPITDKTPPQVETTAAVRLVDKRGMPQATTITAEGMRIFLASAPVAPAAPARGKPKTGSVSGVRKVVLPEQVTMNLWVDPKGGFLATGKPDVPAAPAERSNVQITTPGAFTYEVGAETDKARFEMKPGAGPGGQPGLVQVLRPMVKDGATLYDRLDCETLEMQFGRGPTEKPGVVGPPVPKDTGATDLQWVHAWGQNLVLTSQAENLQAHGNDLRYEAITKLTTLKGSPEIVAVKDGHEIHAPELQLTAADGQTGQQATAIGVGYFKGSAPGEVGPEGPRNVVARWRDRMHYQKSEGSELITLTGAARFEDPSRQQSLAGDQIKLTLVPETLPANQPAPSGTPKMKPRRLEVTGHVVGRTPTMFIHDSEILVTLFKDAPALPKPAAPAVVSAPPPPVPGVKSMEPPLAAAPEPPKKPLDLAAKTVSVVLLARADGTTELEKVDCEGSVKIRQEPATPQEKPIDMTADALELTRSIDGHLLKLTGDPERPALIVMPDMTLTGPRIELDQAANTVDVKSFGSMRLLSTTDFQGAKLAKPTELNISWKDEMHFNGKNARFQGNVQADQDNAKLLCHSMQVTLDRAINFTQQQGPKPDGTRTANVEQVVCDTTGQPGSQPVSLTDTLMEKGKMLRYQRIDARELVVHKPSGQLSATGPGEVRIVQPGPKDSPIAAPPGPGRVVVKENAPPAQDEMKLTYVRYDQRLKADNDKRTAQFWKNVEVLHIAADDPALKQGLAKVLDKLPIKALYLKCELLTVYTQERGGKKFHIMQAEQRATVESDDFIGQADVIKYDEEKQLVTFEGAPGRLASGAKKGPRGQDGQSIKGVKFVYNRLTGQFEGGEIYQIRGGK